MLNQIWMFLASRPRYILIALTIDVVLTCIGLATTGDISLAFILSPFGAVASLIPAAYYYFSIQLTPEGAESSHSRFWVWYFGRPFTKF